jgi:uncharacterized protein
VKVDRLIKFELGKLNAHMPEKRMTLRDAMLSDQPQVSTKNGGTHSFKRDELKFLSEILPTADWDSLQLPIFISLEPSLGRGSAKIRGGVEARIARMILGKDKSDEDLNVYRPEIAVLRKKLPTTTQYLFMW